MAIDIPGVGQRTGFKGKGWHAPKIVTRTLKEIDLPQFSFTFHDPQSMLFGEVKKLTELFRGEDQTASMADLFVRLKVKWDLTNPETGEDLPDPCDDPSAVDYLPLEVVQEIGRLISERISGEESVPPTNGIEPMST